MNSHGMNEQTATALRSALVKHVNADAPRPRRKWLITGVATALVLSAGTATAAATGLISYGDESLVSAAHQAEAIVSPLGIYGGSWIDADARVLHVRTTAPLPANTVEKLDSVVGEDHLELSVGSYTEQYLSDVASTMARSELVKAEYFTSSSVNPKTSRVDVVFLPTAPVGAEQTWIDAFGPSLSFTRAEDSNIGGVG